MFRENLLSWLRENSDDRLIDRGSSKNFKKTLNFVFESIRNEWWWLITFHKIEEFRKLNFSKLENFTVGNTEIIPLIKYISWNSIEKWKKDKIIISKNWYYNWDSCYDLDDPRAKRKRRVIQNDHSVLQVVFRSNDSSSK